MSWAPLVARIQSGDEAAVFELYEAFARGIRWQLGRTIGMRDAADRVHNTFIAVVSAIRAGRLEDPERLPGYIQTIARCQAAEHVSDAVKSRRQHSVDSADLIDRGHNPEEAAIRAEQLDIAVRVLREMKPREREILTRYYLLEQSQEQIVAEMQLSGTQFRLRKWRALERFAREGQKSLRTGSAAA